MNGDHPSMKFVPKGWGYEKIIVNKTEYCGKLLYFAKGRSCSSHVHRQKDEMFYLSRGKLKIKYFDGYQDASRIVESEGGDYFLQYYCDEVILEEGDNFYVPPGRVHKMIALLDSELFEFSTQDFEEDSIKLVKGD